MNLLRIIGKGSKGGKHLRHTMGKSAAVKQFGSRHAFRKAKRKGAIY